MGGRWCTNSVFGSNGVSLWKYIRRGWPTLSIYLKFEIGDGSRVTFCLNRWCGNNSLAICFLKVFQDFP